MSENLGLLKVETSNFLKPGYEAERKKSEEVQNLARQIDVTNAKSILEFAEVPERELKRISDDILSTTRSSKQDEASVLLKNLSKLMDKTNIKDFEKEANPNPNFLVKMYKKVRKFDILAKYRTLDKEVKTITGELTNYKIAIEKGRNDLLKLYNAAGNYSVDIIDYIYAIELVEDELKQKLEDIKNLEDVEDDIKNNEIAKYQLILDQVMQKHQDLETTRTVYLQTMPMIEMMLQNDYGLARKLHSTLTTTVPVFQNAIILAENLKRQRITTRAISATEKTTRDLMQRNAENVSRNSKEIAKIANSAGIDIETLKKNFETIKQGIQDTKAIQVKARSERENHIKELKELNKKMAELKVEGI